MKLQSAIINTLEYSALFNYPLTKKEIYKYLICSKPYLYKSVAKQLNILVKSKKIYKVEDFFLTKKITKEMLKNKKDSIEQYRTIYKKVKKDLSVLNKLFFIKFVGITGSVAAKDLKNYYDIDLFFICQTNFVWISRLFVVLLFKFKGVYKKPYCPNIYIEQGSIRWSEQNVYIANEIVRLKPVFNKNNTYEFFLSQNRWVLNFIPNFNTKIKQYTHKKTLNITSYIFLPIEALLYIMEYIYMFPKISTEKISFNKILFFKKNYSSIITKKFKFKNIYPY